MSATFYAAHNTSGACQRRSERMPFSMPAMAMCMSASAAASAILLKTGVVTPVSLFSVALLIIALLLVGLVIISLISLTLLLTGLTRLVGLESLVRLKKKLATRSAQGD